MPDRIGVGPVTLAGGNDERTRRTAGFTSVGVRSSTHPLLLRAVRTAIVAREWSSRRSKLSRSRSADQPESSANEHESGWEVKRGLSDWQAARPLRPRTTRRWARMVTPPRG